MYMSPEQARSAKRVDHRSDIFSLGVSLYEALTGQRPWQATSLGELVLAICTSDPPPIMSVAPWIGPGLAGVIHKALARSPDLRFASAAAFASALRPHGEPAVTRAAIRGISEERRRAITAIRPSVWTDTALAETSKGDLPSAATPPLGATLSRRGRMGLVAAAGVVVAAGALGLALATRAHPPPARWWTAARATVAVPILTSDPRRPCPEWLPGAIAEGLTKQLLAGGEVRAVGPRELAGLSHATSANAKALRTAFGADAVLEASCARSGSAGVEVAVRALSTEEHPRELASFEAGGSADAPSVLVARVADTLRTSLGLPRPDPVEIARAERALPRAPEGAREYVEALAKLDRYDAAGARELLQKVIGAEPQFAPAHAALAETYAYFGDQKSAAREDAIAAENASSLPNEERLVVEGDAAFAAYAWDRAIETYAALVRVFPDRTDVAIKLVQAYVKAGRARDARVAIDGLLAKGAGDTGDPRVHIASASVHSMGGEYRKAAEEARLARELARNAGSAGLEAQALVAECFAETSSPELDRALLSCAEAARAEETLGDPAALVSVLSRNAYLHALRAELDQAGADTARALEIATRVGSGYLRATALLMQANITKRRGDYPAAIAGARAALPDADASGNAYIQSSARILLAGALLDSGAVEESGRVYNDALDITRRTGNEGSTAIILQNLATYWLVKGEIGRALASATEALTTQQRLGDDLDTPWSLDEVGSIEEEAGDLESARSHLEQAIALRTKLRLPTMTSREDLAEAEFLGGDVEGAIEKLKVAVDDLRAAGSKGEEVNARLRLARALLAHGEAQKALEAAQAGLALAGENGEDADAYAPVRARALYLLGRQAEALAAIAITPAQVLTRRDVRLVADELKLRMHQRDAAERDLQALQGEAHAAGHVRIEKAAGALLAGKVDEGYR